MDAIVEAMLANPWRTLDTVLDGPLHPGGRGASERLLERAAVSEGTRLLDVGCGAGETLSLASRRGADVIGVDSHPDADARAGLGPGSDVLAGEMTALPVATDAADVVVAECVLCLSDDLDAALTETRRVLADGGRLALSDVVVDDDLDVPTELAQPLCLSGPRSRERLLGAVERAGYDIEDTHSHREDLLAMRDEFAEGLDYEGLLGALGERGQRLLDAIERLEAAVEDGRVEYVSLVAT